MRWIEYIGKEVLYPDIFSTSRLNVVVDQSTRDSGCELSGDSWQVVLWRVTRVDYTRDNIGAAK